MGELILETLLGSNIDSIINLNFSFNNSWFYHPETKKERTSNIDLLSELITKQADLKHLYLDFNYFSSDATQKIFTRITNQGNDCKIQTLNLRYSANFDTDETVEKLADVLK